MKYLILLSFLIGSFSFAKTPEEKVLEYIDQKLSSINSPDTFREFTNNYPQLFPNVAKIPAPSMVVEKDKLVIGDVTYSSEVGYRQVLIHGKSEILKALWTAPELFQKVYSLDETSVVPGQCSKEKFKARIYKKVPIIENQDYTLDYTVTNYKGFTFVRAKLDKDETDFALRDNLKVLEETPEGLIVREISYLYPKKWYVSALGPAARATMKTELNKISLVEKCIVEESRSFPPSNETLSKCTKY